MPWIRGGLTLPATRVGPLHTNISRSRLALGDRDGALESLEATWDIAPEMARAHPTSQELMRVLTACRSESAGLPAPERRKGHPTTECPLVIRPFTQLSPRGTIQQ